jgi:hypothetical protein
MPADFDAPFLCAFSSRLHVHTFTLDTPECYIEMYMASLPSSSGEYRAKMRELTTASSKLWHLEAVSRIRFQAECIDMHGTIFAALIGKLNRRLAEQRDMYM